MPRWGIKHGRWWMIQWSGDSTISIGIHIDPKRRLSDAGYYGPYVDFHLIFFVLSLGNHPARANVLGMQKQGGIMRPESG